jgi:hypothetical protein
MSVVQKAFQKLEGAVFGREYVIERVLLHLHPVAEKVVR